MKALKIVGIVVLILVVVVVVVGLLAPRGYFVDRSIIVDAPRDLIFYNVKFYQNWDKWSPWAEMDPEMETSLEGNDGEVGAVSKWVGDPKITGKGQMTTTEVTENKQISYHLEFIEPWASRSNGFIKLMNADGGIEVTWGDYGKLPFPMNIMLLFKNMDDIIGKDFENGLGRLKALCEKEAAAIASYKVEKVRIRSKSYAAIQKEISFGDIKSFYESSFRTIQEAMQKRRARTTGAPAGLYFSWNMQTRTTNMAAAVPTSRSVNEGDVTTINVPRSTAYTVDHYGSYEGLEYAHMALDRYLKENDLEFKPPIIEEYLTDPGAEPDTTKWLTKIYYMVK